jgi:hypothetical protein
MLSTTRHKNIFGHKGRRCTRCPKYKGPSLAPLEAIRMHPPFFIKLDIELPEADFVIMKKTTVKS